MSDDSTLNLIAAAKECREACAACFRVIAEMGEPAITAMEIEFLKAGVTKGFGVRIQDAIARAEAN